MQEDWNSIVLSEKEGVFDNRSVTNKFNTVEPH